MIKIEKKENCSGCKACFNICPVNAIYFEEDKLGFKYPAIDDSKCIKCGVCKNTCPIFSPKENILKIQPKAYAVKILNDEIRAKSSSGGVFSLLAESIIKDGGVVFGAAFDNEFNVYHTYVDNINNLDILRGSKYVQSDIGDTFIKVKDFLEEGRKVLFTGTPCQIAGLNSFLRKEYKNLYMQDFICHGVPSNTFWKRYLEYRRSIDKDTPIEISFREKNPEWSKFSVMFKYKDKTILEQHRENIYMLAFLKNISLRDSCYACNFKTLNKVADITLADFWGIKNICPKMDDKKGTSLVILNSEKGEALFNQLSEAMEAEEVNLYDAIQDNTPIIESVYKNENRDKFIRELDLLDIETLVKKYCINRK